MVHGMTDLEALKIVTQAAVSLHSVGNAGPEVAEAIATVTAMIGLVESEDQDQQIAEAERVLAGLGRTVVTYIQHDDVRDDLREVYAADDLANTVSDEEISAALSKAMGLVELPEAFTEQWVDEVVGGACEILTAASEPAEDLI